MLLLLQLRLRWKVSWMQDDAIRIRIAGIPRTLLVGRSRATLQHIRLSATPLKQ